MDRWVIDLGTARDEEAYMISTWKSFYIGACDGDVLIRVSKPSNSPLDPYDFGKINLVGNNDHWIFVTNDAQAGKELVVYIQQKTSMGWFTW